MVTARPGERGSALVFAMAVLTLVALTVLAVSAEVFSRGAGVVLEERSVRLTALSDAAVAETLAHRITQLSPGQGALANSVSSGLVIGASLMGAPVSTTHVSTGALFGIGIWNRETDWSMVRGIVLAWVGTLPLAALLAAAFGQLLH